MLVSVLLATPSMIFWLWLIFHPPSVAINCPKECSCKADGYYVTCPYSSLKSISSTFPTHVQTLVLDGNSTTFFENDTFVSKGLGELGMLKADFCKLRKIELGAFNGLTKLKHLLMKNNEISEIVPGTFQKMSSLEYLDLGNNRIEHLESNVFYGLAKLKYVYLEGNRLQYLHPDTFVGLPNLQILFLSNNFGLQIPTDRHFINSHSLKRLHISGCNVSSVSVETFVNISALDVLDLSYNYMNILDINILKLLPYLSKIYLYGNPLQCDCQLQELWRWCQDRNIETAYMGIAPKCDTPSEVKGIWWGVLENGQCLEGNINFYGDYKNTRYSYTPIKDIETKTALVEIVSSFVKQYIFPVSAILFILGTISNVIIIVIITCNKDMRTLPNMYILNLAISDMIILTLIFCIDLQSVIPDSWQYAQMFCTFLPFCFHMSFGLTAYSVAVLSIQRYMVTMKPLHVRAFSEPTWFATVATICGVWFVAALSALPAARLQYLCFQPTLLLLTNYFQLVCIFELLMFCVLPLCVNAFSYTLMNRHLLKGSCVLFVQPQNPLWKKRKHAANVVLGLTVVFLISCVPYRIFETYIAFRISIEFSVAKISDNIVWVENVAKALTILKFLLSINSCLNPVALFCTSRDFRRQFKRYLTCCCKTNSSATDLELTRRN
jgi:hypothetical protein